MLKALHICFYLLFFSTALYAAEPVRIGMSLSLSGSEASVGRMQERAFRLWETHVNQGGGILGRKVKLTVYDDEGDAETARRLYRHMIEKEKMDLLFSPYSSGIMAAILPLTEKHEYPMLASGAGADSLFQKGYRYLFGIFPPASIYSLGFLELLLTNGFNRVAIISSDEPFGKNIAEGAEKWSKRLGMHVVYRETIKSRTQQFDMVAKKARNAGAQAVLMCGHFNEAVNMRWALKRINWQPKAYWASAGPDLKEYYDALDGLAENAFSSTQWQYYEKLPYPGSKEFYRSFVARYKIKPSYHAATAYAAGFLMQTAIQKTGSLNRAKLREVLSYMDTMTLLGRYGVNQTGMQIRYFHLVTQWIDGHKEVVWPAELRTSRPRF